MGLRDFLRWWGEQLAEWLPQGLRESLAGNATELRLTPQGAGWRIALRSGGGDIELGAHPDMDAAALQSALARHPRIQRISLQLPPGHYLARTVDLPVAAAADLHQAIGYQLDALTPFNRDQVWLYCGQQQRLPDGKRLRAWLVTVPRRTADVLGALGLHTPGEAPSGPRRAPAPDQPVTLAFRPATARGGLPLGWALAGLNLVALVLAAGLHLDNRQAELDLLRQETRALQERALAASDLAREADDLQRQLDTLQQLHDAQPTRVAVIEELSRRLGDDTWAMRLELRQQQLRLMGTSANPSEVIRALDGSPMLGDVRFEAALTRDPGGAGERFNLTGRILAPATEDTK